jgi:multicomponent K+:H+ antiporter subunit F
MFRLVTSQAPGDRILALDTMVINAIALIILFGIKSGTAVYFELSLIIAMVGFVSTVAYARYLLRGNVIE